ncbi:hypothetical protein K466DRAFT_609309 [Polyporus arcularius HHB13444]|uniref:F-box domain-containing protein n=1 Tax=Polyporus arcularius HHB13444 TaxID=1314778 RepID=A0A5C3PK38_9APHY|nr:hypothetical protein K466DRAFT_609309 [Polyporus arcularius HHB13444]
MDLSTTFRTTATFDVFFHGREPGHVFSYENALVALKELKPYPGHIRRLTLGPISNLAFREVQDALSSFHHSLDTLEELRVFVWYPNGPPRPQNVQQLELIPGIFPSLRTLSLDGVYMNWENGVFRRLTRVELRNCPGFGLSHLSDFLGVLPTWTSLTELHLSKFLTISDRDELLLEDTKYVMRPPNLRTLVVDDHVYQMSHILHNLDIPGPEAKVRLIGYSKGKDVDDERSPFSAMIPFDNNFPTIFKRAVHVVLVVTAQEARLSGFYGGGTLTLDVPDLDRSGKDALPQAFRSALISLVDVFAARSAPVSFLVLSGDISEVSEQEWGTVFQTVCPQLSELVVQNTGNGDGMENLFNALTHAFEGNQTVAVCPELWRLKFSSATDASGSILGHVGEALRRRAEVCQSPLRRVELELFVDNLGFLPPSTVELHRQAFKSWVRGKVRVEVRPLQTSMFHGY